MATFEQVSHSVAEEVDDLLLIQPKLEVILNDNPDQNTLTEQERELLTATSLGKSVKQLRRNFGSREIIDSRYKNLQGKFGVATIAAVVGSAIEQELLIVRYKPEEDLLESLSRTDLFVLRCMARGVTEETVAERSGRSLEGVFQDFNRTVTGIRARTRSHAVRRAHKIGAYGAEKLLTNG